MFKNLRSIENVDVLVIGAGTGINNNSERLKNVWETLLLNAIRKKYCLNFYFKKLFIENPIRIFSFKKIFLHLTIKLCNPYLLKQL
jgi:hypothetical protein